MYVQTSNPKRDESELVFWAWLVLQPQLTQNAIYIPSTETKLVHYRLRAVRWYHKILMILGAILLILLVPIAILLAFAAVFFLLVNPEIFTIMANIS